MKVTYIAYLQLIKSNPEVIQNKKIVPGDPVDIPDRFKKLVDKDHILKTSKEEDSEEMKELGKKIVEEKKLKRQQKSNEIKKIWGEEKEGKDIEPKEKKKNDFILELDDKTKKAVDIKMKMKKEGKTKKEIKEVVDKVKNENKPKKQRGRPKNKSESGRLVKDPETGEFKRI